MIATTLLALAFVQGVPTTDNDLKKRAEELVAQLGDKDYRDRERAAKELLDMGYAAKEAVLAGQKNPDGEISDRCHKLYPAIWRHDLEKRVQKFLDNPAANVPEDLPGAARWLKVAGDGKESRELYAEMVKAHPEPLLDAELNPERLREVYIDLMKTVYQRVNGRRPVGGPVERATPLDSEVLLFLFLGGAGDVRPNVAPGVSSSYYYLFLNSTYLSSKLPVAANAPLRKLYAGWLEKERYTIALRQGLNIAAQHNVKECAPTAIKVASDPRSVAYVRATAVLCFAKLGEKENLKDLDPFFNDKMQVAIVAVNGVQGSVQMRDVALGAAIHLMGQNHADYGFERRPPSGMVTTTSYTYYAFATDEKRDAAHAKWKEWVASKKK